MQLTEATLTANFVVEKITPYCRQVEILGDIRRKVLDAAIPTIIILAVPDPTKLFELRDVVNHQVLPIKKGAFPSKETTMDSAVFKVIIHWCTPPQWGCLKFIYTGPEDFTIRAINYWRKISNGGSFSEGRLLNAEGTELDTPTEEDVFRHLGIAPVPPEKRKSKAQHRS